MTTIKIAEQQTADVSCREKDRMQEATSPSLESLTEHADKRLSNDDGVEVPHHHQPSEDAMTDNTEANNTKTNSTKTREAHEAYVANRREVGRVIDIETCDIAHRNSLPFFFYAEGSDSESFLDTYCVCSEDSDGWIVGSHLPPEKQQVLSLLYEYKVKLSYTARALHPLYEYVNREPIWNGDGKEPSQGALIEWFKITHPTLASEIKRKIVAELTPETAADQALITSLLRA